MVMTLTGNRLLCGLKTNLWLHVIEHTEHASLVRTWRYMTEVVCPLDFFVPESVRELKGDLEKV